MNIILMRTKVDHLNAWWEPHATSTPLKKISTQSEIKNKAQKQVVVQKDSVNLAGELQYALNAFDVLQNQPAKNKPVDSKRSRKSRLSYFDPSSSSEDDSGEIKRPLIKLGSKESSTKTLRNREPENEEISTVRISSNRNHQNLSMKHGLKTRKKMSVVENTKNQNNNVQDKKNKAQTEADSYIEDICMDSDEENKIFSYSKRNKSLLKENKSFFKKKVNSMNYSRNDENSRHPSDFNETEKKKLRKISKTSRVHPKPKQLKRNINKNSQALTSYQKGNTNNSNKLSKSCKMKSKKIMDGSGTLNNHIKSPVSKKVRKCTFKHMMDVPNSLPFWENKSNLSHQLFSESREQECINTLDLKSDEDNEEVCTENKEEEERLKSIKQEPEKHCDPKDQSPELPITLAEKESEFADILPKNNSQIQADKPFTNTEKTLKGNKTKNNCKIKNCFLRNNKDQGETEQVPIAVTENEVLVDKPKSKSFKNQLVNVGVLNCSSSSQELKSNSQNNEVPIKDTLKCVQEKNTGDSSENSVFKQLDKLSFNGNGSGCSVVQCWNVNNIKCGVFKLSVKSQFACQTLHSNSHLGGVLVKGHLRMKIGIKEQDLKEGDMAFVPPLTEWQATNIGECESVFYYWCGRLGS